MEFEEEKLDNDSAVVERKSKKTIPKFDFDVILMEIGAFKRYQVFLVAAVYYCAIPFGMNQVGSVFLSAIPEYRCWIPEIDDTKNNFTDEDMMQVTTPYDSIKKKYDGCKQYVYKENCTSFQIDECFENQTTTCADGHVFDEAEYDSTTTTEWDLVCDRLYLGTLATSVYFSGLFFGVIIGGNLGDRFGRTRVLIFSQVLTFTFCVACSFSPNLATFAAMRFFIAASCSAAGPPSFVYAIEIIGDKWRTVVGVSIQIASAIGYMTLSGLSYKWRDWRQLQLAIAMFSTLFFVIWFFIPESPRWLLSKGHIKKAKKISNKMAIKNGQNLSSDIWDKASVDKEETIQQRHHYPHILFKKPHMRRITINIMYCWFVVSLVYYGLSLNVGSLAGDDRVNNLLGGVCEIVSCIFVILTMDKFGRRPILSIGFLTGGISCILSTVCNYFSSDIKELGVVGAVLAQLGKLAVSGVFAIVYNYTAELFPTVVRATAIGCGSMSARIGSLMTPAIITIQYSIPWFSGAVFGTFSFIAGLTVLLLPETNNAPLTTTLDDAEKFYESAKKKRDKKKQTCGDQALMS